MKNFTQDIWNAANWAWTDRENILAAIAALIAGASAFVKCLQTFVDFVAHHFPVAARANNTLTGVLKFLAWLSHIRVFNSMALNSKPAHAVQLGHSLPDTSLPGSPPKAAFPISLPIALFCLMAFTGLAACAHLPPLATELIDCGEQGIQQQVGGLTSQVAAILSGSSPSWQNALDSLEAAAGDAVGCAVQLAVSQLTHSANRGTISEVALLRGEQWIRAQPKIYRSP
jgi:hypothetical protein